MLSDPKRLRTPRGHGYLVSWKHRLRTNAEPAAAAIVERLLEDESNVESLRSALGRPEASLDDLAEWLITGLASGALNLLKTRVNPPIFDAPPETDLTDLLPPPEPQRDLNSLTFEVIEQGGEGVPVLYQVHAPSGDPSGSLPAGERRFVGDLEDDAYVEVELSAITLPPRPEVERPSPLGPAPAPVAPSPNPPTPEPGATGTDPSTHAPSPPNGDPSTQTAPFEARVVDELGEPVEGVPLSFFVDGSRYAATTDASGSARIEATSGAGTVSIDSPETLLDVLLPRWAEARDGDWLDEGTHRTFLSPTSTLPVVQLESDSPHTLVFQPKVLLARIRGMLFDTNRSFLLPSALEQLPRLTALYADHPQSTLLLVGHTDTTGEPDFNDPLSLERAQSVAAFLADDVDTWLAWYEDTVPVEKRWGAYEDSAMLAAVYERTGEDVQGSPLRHFQSSRGLAVDGVAGPDTREVLIDEYMALDGTTLPAGVEIRTFGCGESFPLDEDHGDVAASAPDGFDRPLNRRVELFFFDEVLGVLPAATGEIRSEGDDAYLEWRKRAVETHELDAGVHVHSIILDEPISGLAANVDVEATYETGKQLTLRSDADGRLPLEVGAGTLVDLRYEFEDQTFERRVFTSLDDVASPDGAWQRLVHLGYVDSARPGRGAPEGDTLGDALLLFQLDYRIEATGDLNDETIEFLLRAHDQDLRPWRDREWELPDAPPPDGPKPKENVS